MRRSFLLLLAAAPMAACTAVPFGTSGSPAARHASLVTGADTAMGRMLDHLGARERQDTEQAAALRFAAGGSSTRSPPAPVVPLAGAVLDPGMDLIVLQARRIAALADGTRQPETGGEGAAHSDRLRAALDGLRAAPARWPAEAVRRRGLEGFRTLSEPAPAGVDAARLAADRQGALEQAVALLAAVMGEDSHAGLRSVLAQRHEAWREAQRSVLNAARGLGPTERMALWNRVQAALATDGPDLPAAEVVRLLSALPPAHAAAGRGDAAGVAALEPALARFQAVLAQAR